MDFSPRRTKHSKLCANKGCASGQLRSSALRPTCRRVQSPTCTCRRSGIGGVEHDAGGRDFPMSQESVRCPSRASRRCAADANCKCGRAVRPRSVWLPAHGASEPSTRISTGRGFPRWTQTCPSEGSAERPDRRRSAPPACVGCAAVVSFPGAKLRKKVEKGNSWSAECEFSAWRQKCKNVFQQTCHDCCFHVRNKLFPLEKQTVSTRETNCFFTRNKSETNVKLC